MSTIDDDGLIVEYRVRGTNGLTVFVAADMLPSGPCYSIETDGVGRLSREQMIAVAIRILNTVEAGDAREQRQVAA